MEACYLMRDRFLGEEVWDRLGTARPPRSSTTSAPARARCMFRGFLFQRIVPVLRDIGLFGDKIQAAFADMGVMDFADTDLDALVAEDDAVADEFDQMRMGHIESVAARADDD